jgi:hypothetical protein
MSILIIKRAVVTRQTIFSQSSRALYSTVSLSFFKYDTYKILKQKAPEGVKEKKQPLIICHGLFGSKQNWQSLAKAISIKSQCQVYTIVSPQLRKSSADLKTDILECMYIRMLVTMEIVLMRQNTLMD